ncbi:MAG: Gfo/Idh/MocA family oxidoreductase [Acidobacteria bacterium]|nr:Gfo/Idh/MocA family oxidoreductase [Acidobacteriota bacterium]
MRKVSRRDFTKTAALTGAGFVIVPRSVLGRGFQAPSDVLNIATVGIGGMGGSNTQAVMSQNIVALCDVDDVLMERRLAGWRDRIYPIPAPPAAAGTGASGRQGGGGGGAAQAPAGPTWQHFGRSKMQTAADAKWKQEPGDVHLEKFVDQQMKRVVRYRDYREMLEKQKDIDAIIVATPDHMHAVIASNAMDLGKHVYVQKPLCWSVHEARHLAQKAEATKVVTQMGNQGHSQDDARRGQEYLKAGVIGDITEVHVWTNRPLAFWPQGIPRPNPMTGNPPTNWNNTAITRRLAATMAGEGVTKPNSLQWDLFLGVAPDVDYHPVYHPFNWRGWVDWGQGALGDMGAHLIDHPFWGLDLGTPTVIETLSTPFERRPQAGLASYPLATSTHFTFPARGNRPAVKMVWYDGGLTPPKPEEIGDDALEGEGGILYIGTKGKMLQNTYGARPRLLPLEMHNSYGPPPESIARIPHQSHEMNWVNAIKGTDTISCPFSYAAPLTEVMLLGIVSLRANSKIHYDAANMRVTNNDNANQFLTRQYREGYSL